MPQGPEFIRCDYPNPLPFVLLLKRGQKKGRTETSLSQGECPFAPQLLSLRFSDPGKFCSQCVSCGFIVSWKVVTKSRLYCVRAHHDKQLLSSQCPEPSGGDTTYLNHQLCHVCGERGGDRLSGIGEDGERGVNGAGNSWTKEAVWLD